MKTELNLKSFAKTLAAQNESKRDFIVNTKAHKLSIFAQDFEQGPYALGFKTPQRRGPARDEEFVINRFALNQIAQHVKIPMQVVDLLSKGSIRERIELGNLLSVRLQENESIRMIRTMAEMDSKLVMGSQYCRAFLSDRYRRIDNFDLAQEAIMPVLNQFDEDDLKIESLAVTEERMYIKALCPPMSYEIGKVKVEGRKVGDIVQAGIVISNSEVGAGRFSIEPLIFRLCCLNGAISQDYSMKRNHVGAANGTELNGMAEELFSTNTLALTDAALFAQIRDTLEGTFSDEDKFEKIVTRFMETKGEPITGQVPAAVQELGKRYTLNEGETAGIMDFLIKGGDLSKFGMVNAITAFARDDEKKMTYDRATQLEKVGGQVIELGKAEWKTIAEAVEEGTKKGRGRKTNNN